jgi:hypothetical protein
VRVAYGDPETSHSEAVAAAELDRSYAGSPIVSGEASAGVAPGRLLPDVAEVDRPDAGTAPLHQFAHRPGHTVIVVGGPAADPGAVADLVELLEDAHDESPAVEAVFGFSTRPGESVVGRIDEESAEGLGIDAVTVLAIRPDRYVGLRHDGTDPEAVARYLESLTG